MEGLAGQRRAPGSLPRCRAGATRACSWGRSRSSSPWRGLDPAKPHFGGPDPLQGGPAICPKGAASLLSTRGALGTHLPRGELGTPAWRGRPLVATEKTARPLVHPLGWGPPLLSQGTPASAGGLHPSRSVAALQLPSVLRAVGPGRSDGVLRSPGRHRRGWPQCSLATVGLLETPPRNFLPAPPVQRLGAQRRCTWSAGLPCSG